MPCADVSAEFAYKTPVAVPPHATLSIWPNRSAERCNIATRSPRGNRGDVPARMAGDRKGKTREVIMSKIVVRTDTVDGLFARAKDAARSDDARDAPADTDLRWLAQVKAPSDVLTARRNRRPCNAICMPRSPRATSAKVPICTPATVLRRTRPTPRRTSRPVRQSASANGLSSRDASLVERRKSRNDLAAGDRDRLRIVTIPTARIGFG